MFTSPTVFRYLQTDLFLVELQSAKQQKVGFSIRQIPEFFEPLI